MLFVSWVYCAALACLMTPPNQVSGFVLTLTNNNIGSFTTRRHGRDVRIPRPMADTTVDQLLSLVDQPPSSGTLAEIQQMLPKFAGDVIDKDDDSIQGHNETDFRQLLGNYNVSCTLPAKASERPVGGKLNNVAIFRLEHSWQHLLPAKQPDSVAQVINMIVLRVFATLQVHVILRGDAFALSAEKRQEIARERATPGGLSPRTVRADFHPPRIVVSRKLQPWLAFSLGPKSSVVLDTLYCDDRVRIGKGSRGSQFVFVRSCNDPRADEWVSLVQVKPIRKRSLVVFLGTLSTVLWWIQSQCLSGMARWLTVSCASASTICTALVAISTGGIERDRVVDSLSANAP